MKHIKVIAILLSLTLIMNGCFLSYGDNIYSQKDYINRDTTNTKANTFYTFFNGEPIDFEYERLAMVETEGNNYASNETVLDHMRYDAWTMGANALINIKDNYKEREKGYLMGKDENKTIYTAKVYNGLAVKIKTDSSFIEKYGNGRDTSFVSTVENERIKQVKKANNEMSFSIFAGILGIIALIIAGSSN